MYIGGDFVRPRRCLNSKVSITLNENEGLAIREGLNLLNIKSMINCEDVVVITPNWVNKEKPEFGVVVGPESLREIIKIVKECNPKRIVVATGSAFKDTQTLMKEIGFYKILEEEKVEFIDLNQGPYIRIDLNHSKPIATNLNKLFEEMTFLISFTQLKIHEEAVISAAIKNIALGWPPGEEHGYPKKNLGIHTDLHGFITAMLEKFTIDLSIVSASPAMVGTGPSKGIATHTGLVLCGTDPVATDTIGARFLGFKPQAIRYLFNAINKGLGVGDLSSGGNSAIQLLGMDILEAEKHFSECAYGKGFTLDK